MNPKLKTAWKKRLMMREKGRKLWDKGFKLSQKVSSEGGIKNKKCWIKCGEVIKLFHGYDLQGDGHKLMSQAETLWAQAVMKEYGNIWIEFKRVSNGGYECRLANGEVFK